MSKDPAVLFYTSDFLSGTQFFTDEQCGQYIRLLCQQHQLGHIPEQHMLNICRTYDSPVFMKFAKDQNGFYYNERMDIEKEKRIKYCESRRSNKMSEYSSPRNSQHMSEHMSGHMDNGNENDNINVIKKGIVKGKQLESAEDAFPHLRDTSFKNSFNEFLEMRKLKKKPATNRAKELILDKLCGYSLDVAKKMLEKSIVNAWTDVYELKEDISQTRNDKL